MKITNIMLIRFHILHVKNYHPVTGNRNIKIGSINIPYLFIVMISQRIRADISFDNQDQLSCPSASTLQEP